MTNSEKINKQLTRLADLYPDQYGHLMLETEPWELLAMVVEEIKRCRTELSELRAKQSSGDI